MRKIWFILIILGLLIPKILEPAEYVRTNQQKEQMTIKFEENNAIKDYYKTIDSLKTKFKNKKTFEKWKQEEIALKVVDISNKLNIDISWLIKVILLESRGDPNARNKKSKATGILQWIPSTAKDLNTDVDIIKNMSILEQLIYVEHYLNKVSKDNISSYEDLYLAVFYPLSLTKDDNYIISDYNTNPKILEQNPGMTKDTLGRITKESIKKFAQRI